MFIEALFMVARIWKQHNCLSADEWIKKKKKICEKYTQWNITQPEKNGILPFATMWMDLVLRLVK